MVAVRSLWWMLLLFGNAEAGDVLALRTAAQTASEPKFVQRIDDGRRYATGLCMDINRAIERVDPGIRFDGDQDWKPLTRLEAEITKGNLDVACGLIRTRVREASLVYLEPALFSVHYYLAARVNDDVKIENWDDVRALGSQGVILVKHGYGPVDRLKELGGLQVDSGASDSRSNLLKLVAGRGRFYYHRSPGIVSDIRRSGMEDKIKVLPTAMDVQRFYMVAGKHVPAGTIGRLHRALARLEASGELKRIADHWHEQVPPHGQL